MNREASLNHNQEPAQQTTEQPIRPAPKDHRPAMPEPQPGDLILVERSGWYALQDGELLRVCECDGWATPGRDIYVAPRNQVRTFWGPNFGEPDGIKPICMSTSGGPFKTITLAIISPLERLRTQLDMFWRWQDRPRAGGGVEYQREVTVWKLDWLPDTSTYPRNHQEAGR